MENVLYTSRSFINPLHKSATSYVAAFHGLDPNDGEYGSELVYFRLASCLRVVDIPYNKEDTPEEYIERLEKIRSELGKFVEHLKETIIIKKEEEE